jgi:Holliday junction resolvase
MSKSSRDKGKRGEREAAGFLNALLGCNARRGVQYHGGPNSPDIVDAVPGVHFEVKRVEKLNIHDALAQAVADAGIAVPVVLSRRNRGEWLITMRAADMVQFAEQIQETQKIFATGMGDSPMRVGE